MTPTLDADVLIIGVGPAGSVAACLLRRLGHRVTMLEREQFPRFSIGESLLPQCMAFLEQAGLLDCVAQEGFQHKNGAAFSHAGKLTEFDFTQKFSAGWGATYQVPRARFDHVLADGAARSGAAIHYRQRISAVDFSRVDRAAITGIDEHGAERIWHTHFVLDASGFVGESPSIPSIMKFGTG